MLQNSGMGLVKGLVPCSHGRMNLSGVRLPDPAVALPGALPTPRGLQHPQVDTVGTVML